MVNGVPDVVGLPECRCWLHYFCKRPCFCWHSYCASALFFCCCHSCCFLLLASLLLLVSLLLLAFVLLLGPFYVWFSHCCWPSSYWWHPWHFWPFAVAFVPAVAGCTVAGIPAACCAECRIRKHVVKLDPDTWWVAFPTVARPYFTMRNILLSNYWTIGLLLFSAYGTMGISSIGLANSRKYQTIG